MNNSHLPEFLSRNIYWLGNGKHKKNAIGTETTLYVWLLSHGDTKTTHRVYIPLHFINGFSLSLPLLLGCPIKGHPTPNITWFHGSQPVATVTGLTHHILAAGQILQVANLSGGSQGEFSCLAQNEAGTLVQKASLVIQGKKPCRLWSWA